MCRRRYGEPMSRHQSAGRVRHRSGHPAPGGAERETADRPVADNLPRGNSQEDRLAADRLPEDSLPEDKLAAESPPEESRAVDSFQEDSDMATDHQPAAGSPARKAAAYPDARSARSCSTPAQISPKDESMASIFQVLSSRTSVRSPLEIKAPLPDPRVTLICTNADGPFVSAAGAFVSGVQSVTGPDA